MAAPTFKKATDTDAGDSTKYGAPDLKYALDVLDATHATDRVQASSIETTGSSDVQTDLDLKAPSIGPVLTTPQINDTSSDHQYILGVSELLADRTITLPLLTGNDTFATLGLAQTFSAINTFSAAPVFSVAFSSSGQATFSDATNPPIQTEFSSALSGNTVQTAINVSHAALVNMTDGHGPAISFIVSDDTANDQPLGDIDFIRSGADNTGQCRIRPTATGTKTTVCTLSSSGAVDWPVGGNHTNFVYDEDGTGNAITNLADANIKAAAAIAGSKLNVASSDLSDSANVPLLDASNVFTDTLTVTTASFPVFSFERTVTTNATWSVGRLTANSSTALDDTFGARLQFLIGGLSANGVVAGIVARRDGADTQGKIVFQTNAAQADRLTIRQDGSIENFSYDEDGTGNSISNLGSTTIKAEFVTGQTEEASPVSGDFLLGVESGGAIRKFDIGNLPTSAGDMVLASVQTVTGAKTFADDALLVQNPAETFEYTIQGGAIAADRILNLPVTTATDTIATLGLAQTFTDSCVFSSSLSQPFEAKFVSALATNTVLNPIIVKHETSQDMVDGFGCGIVFTVTDSGASNQALGAISFERDGADNTGKCSIKPSAAGVSTPTLEMTAAGAIDWPEAGNHTNFVLDEDGTGNAITNLDVASIKAASSLLEAAIPFVIDGGGSAITTGVKGYIEVPFDGTIKSVRMLADQTGSIVVDIWKDTYANYPPVDADSITASAVPTISSATKSEDTTLTGWTTTVSKGDILGYNVDSATTVERVTLSLLVDRT